jgi:para-nitrobenzyl esterase
MKNSPRRGAAGMLDIVRALEWVQTNIAQLEGDPNQVIIFGQSGGGRKVETLLAMPSAKGSFHGAAIKSGVAVRIAEREIAIRNAEHVLAKLGIPKSNCRDLQKVPVQQLMAAYFDVMRESPPLIQMWTALRRLSTARSSPTIHSIR